MKKLLFILAALVLTTWACNNQPEEATDPDLEKAMTVSQIQDNMADWEDSTVIIKGTVHHVCKHGGGRIVIMENDSTRIHIEAGDEIKAFDATLANAEVLVWAVVKWEKIDEAYLLDWESRVAQQESEAMAAADTLADPSSVDLEHFVEERAHIAEVRAEVAASPDGFVKDYYLEGVKIKELVPAVSDDDEEDDDDDQGDVEDDDDEEGEDMNENE